jgi:hypothetical protein
MFSIALQAGGVLAICFSGAFQPEDWPAFAAAYKKAILGTKTRIVLSVDLIDWVWPELSTVADIVTRVHDLSRAVRWWSAMILQGEVIMTGSEALTQLVRSIVRATNLTSPLYCVSTREEAAPICERLAHLAQDRLLSYAADMATLDASAAACANDFGITWADIGYGRGLALLTLGLLRLGSRVPKPPT